MPIPSVQLASLGVGTVDNRQGAVKPQEPFSITTTVYQDPSLTIPLTTLVTDNDGQLPGYIASGIVALLTVKGKTYQVDSVSANDPRFFLSGSLPTNPRSFGAVGDGVTDDTVAVQATLNASTNVVFSPGTYKITAGLVVPNSNTSIDFGKAVMDYSSASSGVVAITATGTAGVSYPLQADTIVNDTGATVTVGDELNFTTDDEFQIGSPVYYEIRTAVYGPATGQYIGELGYVSSVTPGRVTTHSRLVGGSVDGTGATVLNYKVADGAFIRKITPIENVTIQGGTFLGIQAPATNGQICIFFNFARNCRVKGVTIKHFAALGVQFHQSLQCRAENCYVDDAYASLGYGYAASAGSQEISYIDCDAHNCRHGFTTGGGQGTYGPIRRVYLINVRAYGTLVTTGDTFKTHACAEDIHLFGCTSEGGSDQAIAFEHSSGSIIGCLINHCLSNGIICTNHTYAPGDLTIQGNVVKNTGLGSAGHAISIGASNIAGSGLDNHALIITGNRVYNPVATGGGGGGIQVMGTSVRMFPGTVVANNVVDRSNGGANAAIRVLNSPGAIIANNKVHRVQPNDVGMAINSCTRFNCQGNNIDYETPGTGIGITCTTAIEASITENIITNGTSGAPSGTGIQLVGAGCVSCNIRGNTLLGLATPFTSAGTGHILRDNMGMTAPLTIASASTITLTGSPGNIYNISGTTTINTINTISGVTGFAGFVIVLRCLSAACTIKDGTGNLKLAGDFVSTVDASLSLVCDGTSWVETGRSLN